MSRRDSTCRLSPPSSLSASGTRPWLAWFVIGVVALVVRILYLSQAAGSPLFGVLQGDAETYDRWARGIAAGDVVGKDTFYQAPLYPYVLGCIYAVTGGGVLTARYVQAVLGASSCIFLGKAAERWFDRKTGLLTATILALQPTAIFCDGIIQKTSLEAFLTTVYFALLATAEAASPQRRRLWLATGFVLGLLCLARENALIWAPIALFAAARPSFTEFHYRRVFGAGCVLVGLAIPLAPTAARNFYVGGELQLTTAQFGPNFYIGNHAGASGVYEPLRPQRGMTRYERTDAIELAEAAVGRELTAGEVSSY